MAMFHRKAPEGQADYATSSDSCVDWLWIGPYHTGIVLYDKTLETFRIELWNDEVQVRDLAMDNSSRRRRLG